MESRERIETRDPLVHMTAPARQYALVAGAFLVSLGVLSLVLEDVDFGTVGPVTQQPEFLIWTVSGWTAVFWIAIGAFGLLSAARFESARSYALTAGAIFAVVAVWGFVDGNDVVGLLVADTTNNVTHAVIAGLGLLVAAMPRRAQIPSEPARQGDPTAELVDSRESIEARDPLGRMTRRSGR